MTLSTSAYKGYQGKVSLLSIMCFVLGGLSSLTGKDRPAGNLPLDFELKGNLIEEVYVGKPLEGSGAITFRNGRTDKLLEPQVDQRGATLRFSDLEGVVVSLVKNSNDSGYKTIDVEVANESGDEVWLEVEVSLPFKAHTFHYYDGWEPKSVPGSREGIAGVIPFASLYEEGGIGLALGIDPTQMRSYLANSGTWKEDQGTLRYLTKMVIPSKQKEKVRWIAFAFTAKYGHLNAISSFQQFFPSIAHHAEGIDPNISGPAYAQVFWRPFHEIYTTKESFTNNRGELYRRIGKGWEWGYGGYGYRPGDWLSTEELTGDWKMKHHPEQKTMREHRGRSATEHLNLHLDAYKRGKALGVSTLMYLIPTYCEEDLAEQLYSDSIYHDEFGNPRPAGPPWVHAYDACYQMYCYGNSFGDYTFSVLPKILERAEVSGIAFDCADRSQYNYYGPGVERSPGTSYDPKRGRYSNTDIANSLFIKRVHEIEKEGVRMGVVVNVRAPATSYLVTGEADGIVIERPPWDQYPRPDLLRLMFGKKSITFWKGYASLPSLPDDAEALVKLIENLSDYSLHRSFELGIYLNPLIVSGLPKLFYYQKYAREFFGDLGYEPIAAISSSENKLMYSRYGKGVGSAFFIGNTTNDDIETLLSVDTEYLGDREYLIGDAEGEVVVTNRNEDSQLGPVRVISRQPLLLRTYASFPKNTLNHGAVRVQLQSGVKSSLEIQVQANHQGAYPVELLVPQGYSAGVLRVNGQSVNYQNKKEEGASTIGAMLKLNMGENQIKLTWLPNTELINPEAITSFPYIRNEDQANFAICAENKEEGKRISDRLAWFFGSAINGIQHEAKPLSIDMIPAGEKGNSKEAIIYVGSRDFLKNQGFDISLDLNGRNGIIRSGNSLGILVEGEIDPVIDQFLTQIEATYPTYGYVCVSDKPIPWTSLYKPTFFTEKTGLEYLPWKRK